ncbi:hypothetical protein HBA94_00105 [Ochrobactrum sp. GRS2]|nr:hypothetical protein [Ochrobactrum sp. GRS2]
MGDTFIRSASGDTLYPVLPFSKKETKNTLLPQILSGALSQTMCLTTA